MKKKRIEIFLGILGVVAIACVLLPFFWFTFFTTDSFQNATIDITAIAISKFLILPALVLLIICYALKITEKDLTRGDKSFTVWAKIVMSLFILLLTPPTSFGVRSILFLVFSVLAFLKIIKGDKPYANGFLFYAFLFNPFFKVMFWIPERIAYIFIAASLLIWGVSDLIFYQINRKKFTCV